MKKKMTILAPTDFSAASRAGMRFAIQWARQQDAKLVFVHIFRLLRMTKWTDKQFDSFATAEHKLYYQRLRKFAAEVCRYMHVPNHAYTTRVIEGISADVALTELSRQQAGIDLVCMATRGAGKWKKLFGTHTGNVLLRSEVPVVAVPVSYRAKPIRRILYATDLADCGSEIRRILKLTRGLRAEVIVVHFREPGETMVDPGLVNAVWQKEFGYPVKLRYEHTDPDLSLAQNLQGVIGRLKPSLVVMFTNRQRTLFQRIFYPSQTENLSFHLKVPLLVMGKSES